MTSLKEASCLHRSVVEKSLLHGAGQVDIMTDFANCNKHLEVIGSCA